MDDDIAPDQTNDLDDQELEEIHRLEVDDTANVVDNASSDHSQESEDDVDYHQEAFEVIASMFVQPHQQLVARNNATKALLLHHPDWALEQSFRQAVSGVQNPFDVREVTTALNADQGVVLALDTEWEKFADWDELDCTHSEIRNVGDMLANEAKAGHSWSRVQKSIFSWAIEGIAETIRRAVNALADLIRQETLDAKNKPKPLPPNSSGGSVKPKPSSEPNPQSVPYPKP
jgi:hypothetical protein